MSVLQLKQEITRLTKRDRQEIFAYLVRLKHEAPAWKLAAAQRIRNMKKGRVFAHEALQARLSVR